MGQIHSPLILWDQGLEDMSCSQCEAFHKQYLIGSRTLIAGENPGFLRINVYILIMTINSTFDIDLAIVQALAHKVLFQIPEPILEILNRLIDRMKFPTEHDQSQIFPYLSIVSLHEDIGSITGDSLSLDSIDLICH